ncbi:MAG: alkyl sulfatase dimerization domain-containing protein [Promethearchaeota archaeon]
MMNEINLNAFFGMGNVTPFANGDFFFIPSFGNVGLVSSGEGLILFDVALREFGYKVFNAVRGISNEPITHVIISHGHFDHGFGFEPFNDEIQEKGLKSPEIIMHENVMQRYEKYKMLDKYHSWINSQQFSGLLFNKENDDKLVTLESALEPTIKVKSGGKYSFKTGKYTFNIQADLGETDDAIWMHVPEQNALFTGDLFLYSFPNVGNPYKVQRYPRRWAEALDKMSELEPEFLVPGHGTLISGRKKVRDALSITAEALRFVHDQVVNKLNEGKWFEEIFHEMMEIFPRRFKESEFLRPIYGCYRFAIHCAYRLYHGWFQSGNPTDLFPARSDEIAREFLNLVEPLKILERAQSLFKNGQFQLSLHILDIIMHGKDIVSDDIVNESITLKIKALKKIKNTEDSLIARSIYENGIKELTRQKKLNNLKKKANN